MLRTLGRLYTRRIVNVNVNILVAGVLALFPTVGVVHLTHYFGLGVHNGVDAPTRRESLWIGGITFVADAIADVAIYYVLHWMANHWPRLLHLRGENPEEPHLKFFKDATLVQFERMAISPLLYVLWLGTQYLFTQSGVRREWATVIGFCIAVVAARTVHTVWMLRVQRNRISRSGEAQAQERNKGDAQRQPTQRGAESAESESR